MIAREAAVGRWLAASRTHTVAQLNSAPPATSRAVPNLRDLAQAELSTPGRYHIAKPALRAAAEPWWLQLWDWLSARWQEFWNALFGHVHVGRAQAASIGDVLLVLLGLLFVFVLIRILRDVQYARRSGSTQFETLAEPPAPRQLYQRACDAASRGDYGTAALLLFVALVLLLDRRHAITLTTSATVGDIRRALRAQNGAAVAAFDAVAAPFVQRAYAERPISESQWNAAQKAFVTLSVSKGDKGA